MNRAAMLKTGKRVDLTFHMARVSS
jgi:hypothetical protein